MDKFHDECGVFGIYAHSEATALARLGLYALQHRGQESAGIATTDGERLHLTRAMGQVSEAFDDGALAAHTGDAAIGHVRYSTAGDSRIVNAQPILIDCVHGEIALCHNGNLINASELREALGWAGVHLSDHQRHRSRAPSLRAVEGADAAGRDCRVGHPGARRVFPGAAHQGPPDCGGGTRTGSARWSWVPSATRLWCAPRPAPWDLIGARYVRDVEPGEVLVVGRAGSRSYRPFRSEHPCHCVFEHVYFARPDSLVFGQSVNEVRTNLGRLLAREAPADADVVVPVPDSGMCAAVGYAEESGLPIRMGLIRNHYVGRTFIAPQQEIRGFRVRVKLNPVRSILEGKRVILVDDSIVRGTTCRKIVGMVRAAGAREIHMRISCPPTMSPCYYGIDTPRRSELIGATKTVDEIREFMKSDTLAYLSLDGLRRAVGPTSGDYCTSCYTGDYPVDAPEDAEAYMQMALKLPDGQV